MFNTNQFTDVTDQFITRKGTTLYRDNTNPGVYYSTSTSGWITRQVRTNVRIDSPQGSTEYTDVRRYQINPRGNNNSTILIPQENNRLARVQEMADTFNRVRPTLTAISTRGDTSVIITPDI